MTEQSIVLQRNRELAAILEASKVLTSSFDLEGNLTKVMETLSNHLDMERGCVFLLDPATRELGIVAAHGLTRDEIHRGTYRIGEGVVGRVIHSGSPMFVPDIGVMGALSVDRIYSEEHGGVDDDLRVLRIVASLMAQFVKLWETYRRAEEETVTLRSQLRDRFSLPNIVGESEKFQAVLKSVKKVAGTGATVLLLGESGTGKELVASTLHFESLRSRAPFVAVNCAALPENLLEVELFGCEKGAFTGATARRMGRFETARGGTIFLDEVGELPLSLQAKFLRVLQERTFERVGSSRPLKADVRVIAATNRNLLEDVRAGRFREDLYWRLNVVPIELPPLRERRGDIRLLTNHYVDRFSRAYGKEVRVSGEAMAEMESYAWPGNVRELANTMERLIIMGENDTLEADDITRVLSQGSAPALAAEKPDSSSLTSEVLNLERERICRALREHNHVQHRAARALGITPRQLGYRIKKYGISLERQTTPQRRSDCA
jgi:Nif-specific regulatory protein